MSKDDEIIYRLKNGYAPPFRIEKVHHDDGPKHEPIYLEYILTNIPEDNDNKEC